MSVLRCFLPCLWCLVCLSAQLIAQTDYTIRAIKVERIKVDGQLHELVWQNEWAIGNFTRSIPIDSGSSAYQTEVRLAFDDTYLYVGAKCMQPRGSYRVESLKRDYQRGTSDVLNIALNPFRDGVNGFIFGVNPLGVMREALMDNGQNMSFEWDNKWHAEVQRFDDYWTLEMAIPFRTLRYKTTDENTGWRVNFVRTVLNPWEVSTWVPVPRPFSPQNLAYSGELIWQEAPPPSRRFNTSLIPYVIGKYGVDYVRDTPQQAVVSRPQSVSPNIGGDIKIGLTPSLNLDLTINPDFSQVEVDRQVANLSRFELFFPELRQFFQENRDLFAFYGFPNTRPFFSRRIGLAFNPVLGRNEPVPILAGARLSGKLTNNLRVGLLNMQTKQMNWSADRVLPGANFTVATAQQKVFARSYIGAIIVNKQNLMEPLSETQAASIDAYGRNVGLEYNMYSKDNRWEGEWYYHRSLSPNPAKRDHTFAQFLGYTERRFSIRTGYNHIGRNYTAETGFIPRRGIQTGFLRGGYNIYPKKNKLLTQIDFGVEGNSTFLLSGKVTDAANSVNVKLYQANGATFEWSLNEDYTYLLDPFDPTNLYLSGTSPLPAESAYRYRYTNFEYTGTRQHDIYGSANIELGQYFNGHKQTLSGDVNYRWQPYGIFTVAGVYNRVALPEPYPTAHFWILGPRIELTFTKSLFFNAFFQYNTQTNNFNINTRLQWRFAPVSDFFLVYTDNSWAEAVPNTQLRFLAPKNKALVAKVTYWW